MKREEYLRLCEEVWEHNYRYFVENKPIISDQEFDQLFRQIVEIEKKHPEWVFAGSPTQRVGEAAVGGFEVRKHDHPMLSLANTYNFEQVLEFCQRMQKHFSDKEIWYHCELKMDGIAISVHYEEGLFVRAVTRGDGVQGEDVTANVRTIETLPLKLPKSAPKKFEVRGEVFMPKESFLALNERQEIAGKTPFANPRNAAGGTLKLLDPKLVAERDLSIVFYGMWVPQEGLVRTQYETIEFLKKLHMPVVQEHVRVRTLEEITDFANKIENRRHQLPFEIDGIVIKLDDLKDQKRIGTTGKNYRWAIAYKFAATQAETKIHGITVQVGRTGILTPVAELDPVFVQGSTISRATLHNEDEVHRKDIRINDWVIIEKGGDVIPKVVRVNTEKRGKDSHIWHMVKQCPVCGTEVVRIEGEVAIRCPNHLGCPAQSLGRLIFFVSKSGMDIEHLGKKIAEQLIDLGCVQELPDIYRLKKEQLLQLKNFQDKSAENLLQSIERSKNVSLARFIMALGIPSVGVQTAAAMAARAESLDKLLTMQEQELKEIEGIGPKVAESIVTFFADPYHQREIRELLRLGVVISHEKRQKVQDHPFAGKSFVLTGTLDHYSREEATTLIEERGGKVIGQVSVKTDYLLLGKDPGSKYAKAQKLKVQILSEDEFIKLL